MSNQFKCPSCKAEVKKDVQAKPGCPCCGFGQPAKDHDHSKCSTCHESSDRCRGHILCG